MDDFSRVYGIADNGIGQLGADFNPGIESFRRRDPALALEAYDWLYGRGRAYNLRDFRVVPRIYYHHTGWTDQVTSIQFFNANKQRHVTNLPVAGYIDPDTVFMLKAVSIRVTDISNAGTLTDLMVDDAVQTVGKKVAQAFSGGEVVLKVGPNEVFRVSGIDRFLPAVGMNFTGLGTPAANAVLGFLRGGDGTDNNGFNFNSPYPIEQEDRIELTIEWPASITHSFGGAIPIKAELIGDSVMRKA